MRSIFFINPVELETRHAQHLLYHLPHHFRIFYNHYRLAHGIVSNSSALKICVKQIS